jgi:hypothetical protein
MIFSSSIDETMEIAAPAGYARADSFDELKVVEYTSEFGERAISPRRVRAGQPTK